MRKPGELISGSLDHEGNRTIPRISDHHDLLSSATMNWKSWKSGILWVELVEFLLRIGNFGAERQLETDPVNLIREVLLLIEFTGTPPRPPAMTRSFNWSCAASRRDWMISQLSRITFAI